MTPTPPFAFPYLFSFARSACAAAGASVARGTALSLMGQSHVPQRFLRISGSFNESQGFYSLLSSRFRHTGSPLPDTVPTSRRLEERRCDILLRSWASAFLVMETCKSVLSHKHAHQSINSLIEFLCVRSQGFGRDKAAAKSFLFFRLAPQPVPPLVLFKSNRGASASSTVKSRRVCGVCVCL